MESYIFNLIDRSSLEELLEAFHACIGLPIQVLDEGGGIILQRGDRCSYCDRFAARIEEGSCRRVHTAAGQRAMALGEAYIFSCNANLTHIVFPLVNAEKLYGSVLVGPFLMDAPESAMILDVGKHYPDMTTSDLMDLYDTAADIPVAEPAKVTQISRLLYFLFSNLLAGSREQFTVNRQKLQQQAKISDSIRYFKQTVEEIHPEYPIAREEALMERVREGDLNEARAILNEILGYVFFSGGNDLNAIKSRLVELCAMLCRTAIAGGVPSKRAFEVSGSFLGSIQRYSEIDDLCYALEDVLNTYVGMIFPEVLHSGERAVRDAMRFIRSHFYENITLGDVAGQVYLNESYFSRLFRASAGMTFKDYLTSVRIEEAKRLLKNTDYSLMDIALAVGFDNQSYFSRVFRASVGMTPSEFRKM